MNPVLHVLGDSHIRYFTEAAKLGLLPWKLEATLVGGATAVGMRNPNSQTQALHVFREALQPRRDDVIPVIHLGEVDCGFVIWYRAQKYAESVETQFAQSIDALADFIDQLLPDYPLLVLTGATLPTIRDGDSQSIVANLRREVTATLRQRTDLTLAYNRAIAAFAAARNLPFIDVSDRMLDPASALLDDRYRNPDPGDHHLHAERAAHCWAEALTAELTPLLAGNQ